VSASILLISDSQDFAAAQETVDNPSKTSTSDTKAADK